MKRVFLNFIRKATTIIPCGDIWKALTLVIENETKRPTITTSIKYHTKAPGMSNKAIKKGCNNCK